MSQRNRTESRRFICLIDSLYDHKIRVIASGEDDYWNLFQVLAPNASSGAKSKYQFPERGDFATTAVGGVSHANRRPGAESS